MQVNSEHQLFKHTGEVKIMSIEVTPDKKLEQECFESGKSLEKTFNQLEVLRLVTPEERAGYEAIMGCLRRNINKGIWRCNVQMNQEDQV